MHTKDYYDAIGRLEGEWAQVRMWLLDLAEPTPAESLLWKKLSKRQLGGLKFRRQHTIHTHIVDFYYPAAKLVIEIDGSSHDDQEKYDQDREAYMKAMGYETIRFSNTDVEGNMEMVLAGVYTAYLESNPIPMHNCQGEVIKKE